MFIVRSPLAWVNDVIPRANKQEFETLDKNDEAFKLLVVRHPFDRLERFYDLSSVFFFFLPQTGVSLQRQAREMSLSGGGHS